MVSNSQTLSWCATPPKLVLLSNFSKLLGWEPHPESLVRFDASFQKLSCQQNAQVFYWGETVLKACLLPLSLYRSCTGVVILMTLNTVQFSVASASGRQTESADIHSKHETLFVKGLREAAHSYSEVPGQHGQQWMKAGVSGSQAAPQSYPRAELTTMRTSPVIN